MAERPPAGRPPVDDAAGKLPQAAKQARDDLSRFVKEAKAARAEVSRNSLLVGALFGSDGAASLAVATNALGTVGTAAVYAAKQVYSAFSNIFTEFTSNISRLGSASRALGNVPIQELQGLEFAASRAGVGADALRGTLVDLQNKMYQTTVGNVEAILGFQRLGVSIYKAGGGFKSATDLLDDSVAKLISIKDPTERTGKALASVGQAGLDLANHFATRGVAAFREYRKEVRQFGAELSNDDKTAVEEYRFELGRVGLVMQGLKNTIGGALTPVIGNITKSFAAFAKNQTGTTNAGLRQSVGQFSKLEGAITSLSKFAYKLIPIFGLVVEVLVSAANIVGFLAKGVVDVLIPAFAEFGTSIAALGITLFAVFFPVTAIVAAIFLLVDSVITHLQGGESIVGDVIAAFKKFRDEFLLGDLSQEPYWLRFIREFLKFLVVDIPNAIDFMIEKLADAFRWVGRVVKPITDALEKVERLTGRRNVYTGAEQKVENAPILEQLLFGGGLPTASTVSTTPAYNPGPVASRPAVEAPPFKAEINFTGARGDVKEIAEYVKRTLETGFAEYSESVVAFLNR